MSILGPLNGLTVCAEDGLEGRQTLKAPHAVALHVTKTFFRICCVFVQKKKQKRAYVRHILTAAKHSHSSISHSMLHKT